MKQEHYLSNKIANPFNLLQADNKTLFDLSLKFANGDGVDIDFVAAHICLNIAAIKGCSDSVEYRKELSYDMTAEEISKAQREARQLIKLLQNKSHH